MSIAAGLPTPPFPGRAAHHGTPCDDGRSCADIVTTSSMPIVAAAPAPTLKKSRRPIMDPRIGNSESFMVILLKSWAAYERLLSLTAASVKRWKGGGKAEMQQHPTPDWCFIKASVVHHQWGAHHGVSAQRSSSRMKDHFKSTLFRRPNEFSDETTGG